MDFMVVLSVLATFAFAGWLIWLGYATTEVEDKKDAPKLLLTEAEVKKLTKPKLLELAESLDVAVDSKSKKSVILEEIEKHR
jgi:hypothetical protein